MSKIVPLNRYTTAIVTLFLLLLVSCSSSIKSDQVPPSASFGSGFEAHSPSMGDPTAHVKIYIFSDFTCPECRGAADEAKRLIAKYPEDVQVIFKFLPRLSLEESLNSAKAAIAASAQNRFWDMHDVLFQFSRTRSVKELHDLAMIIALDLKKFHSDFSNESALSLIKKDMQQARSWGLRGTPGFFVNGLRVTKVEELESAVAIANRSHLRLP